MTEQAVIGRTGRDRLRTAHGSRLIGRGRELGDLTRVLAAPPAVVLIEGEAGIGKSRLLREYLASPAGRMRPVLVACCPPFRQPQTLGAVTDALRQATESVAALPLTDLTGALRPLFPEWGNDLPAAPEQAEDATAARHRLFRALSELIDCLKIAVMIVEDVHWADDATLEFLLYLGSRQRRHVSLVATYRSEDILPGSLLPRLARLASGTGGLRLGLGPLSLENTGALVSSMLAGEEVSADFADFVYRRTEGLPLAVEEYVRLMTDRSDLTRRDGGWSRRDLADITVPPTVRDAVLERAGRLSEDAQAILRAAAVLAEAAGEATLMTVSGLPVCRARAGLADALRSRLLDEDARGLMSFRHALAGQAVYAAMPGPDRRFLHLQAGLAMERYSPLPAASLARHFRQAGETGKWRRYTERAAELALASGDETTAVALVRDLIDNARETPGGYQPVVDLLDKITFASITDAGCYRDLLDALRSLLDAGMAGPGEGAEVRAQLGRILDYAAEHTASRAELERAIPYLAGNPALAARAMNMLGWPQDTTSPASVHLRWLRRGEQAALSLEPGQQLPLLVQRATALLLLGEEEGWVAAAEIARGVGSTRYVRQVTVGHLNCGDLATTWGRYADARRWLADALSLAESHHYTRYRELIASTQARLDWVTGTWDGLAERVRRVADDDESELNCRLESSLITGLLCAATGACAEAEDRLNDVLAERRSKGAPYFIMEPAAALARLLLADQRVDQALVVTDEPSAIVTAKRTWVWAADIAPVRVEALAAAGRVGEARDLVAAFAFGLRGRDAPAPRAASVLCRAVLAEARGQQARAAALYGQAASAWQALPRPYDAWLARERQARCLLTAGDRDGSATLLERVLCGLCELGANGDTARVAHRLRELRGPVRGRPPVGRRGYGDQLSPRELDVARLLVEGGTNRDIAARLFLSPKTVARHLDSAMRKLGVSSRTALAVRLVERGLVLADQET